MAAKQGFEGFEPIFGEAKAEWAPGAAVPGVLHRPFLFYAHALDPYRLEIVASDFCSHTLESALTVQDVEDLRDETGIGSSWSEFVDYLIASLSSDDVKLVLGGATFAKLIAHKCKGMPRVSLSLVRLMDSPASDAMGNLSLALYRAFRNRHEDFVKEHERCLQLESLVSSEKEKNESLQKQLDAQSFSSKRKISKLKASDNLFPVSDTFSNLKSMADSEAKQHSATATCTTNAGRPSGNDHQSMKVSQQVVSASRRAKVRGALLQDTEDSDDN